MEATNRSPRASTPSPGTSSNSRYSIFLARSGGDLISTCALKIIRCPILGKCSRARLSPLAGDHSITRRPRESPFVLHGALRARAFSGEGLEKGETSGKRGIEVRSAVEACFSFRKSRWQTPGEVTHVAGCKCRPRMAISKRGRSNFAYGIAFAKRRIARARAFEAVRSSATTPASNVNRTRPCFPAE